MLPARDFEYPRNGYMKGRARKGIGDGVWLPLHGIIWDLYLEHATNSWL